MLELGKTNTLKIHRQSDNGLYLVDQDDNVVLLPSEYIDESWKLGDMIDVFLFKDSENRMMATTLTPLIRLDSFAYLKVNDVSSVGAFLDWGLPKDLFVPFQQQNTRMVVGRRYVVTLYLDYESDRLAASSKIDAFLENEFIELENMEEVSLMVYDETDLGYNVIVNEEYKGLIYSNEIFTDINIGDKLTGYVKNIREDNKLDITLQKSGHQAQDENQVKILRLLKDDSVLELTDKSSPEEIYDRLGISKKAFKRAIGSLYKKRIVDLKKDGIHLIKSRK